MSLSEIDQAAVEATLAQFDKLGRLAFLGQYGYGTATTYLLRHNGHFYDPKAVAGVANQHTTDGVPLKANEFDATQAVSALERLDFEIISFNGIWWVNQGTSYQVARDGGFVWAPLHSKTGIPQGHHQNVNKLRVGQRVIHYANNAIRAIGRVAGAPSVQPQPAALRQDTWIDEGYLCPVDYRELSQQLSRVDIPDRTAVKDGPFDVNGSVKQGYMFPIPPAYLFTLLEFLDAHIPDLFDGEITHQHYLGEEESNTIQADTPANPIVRALVSFKNVVLEGVPGTGKSHAIKQVAEDWRWMTGRDLVQFGAIPYRAIVLHPSSSYEDFVEGLRPRISRSGKDQPYFDEVVTSTEGFGIEDGFFVSACVEAAATPHKDVLVLLDELNRCNVPSVFGDLLLTLEKSKRATYSVLGAEQFESRRPASEWDANTLVTLPYSGRKFFVPDNLYVIATMNTTDRSVAPLDSALRRRFAFHRLEPKMPGADILSEQMPRATRELFAQASSVLRDLNQNALRPCLGPDTMIGHSYFYAIVESLDAANDVSDGTEEIKNQWQYAILPQLIDSVRSLGAEDLLGPATRDNWLDRHADNNKVETARAAFRQLDGFLQEALDLRIVVEGVGLGRGARIEEHSATDSDPVVDDVKAPNTQPEVEPDA